MPILMDVAMLGYAGIALLFMVLPGTGEAMARYRGELLDKEMGSPGDDGSQDDEFRRQRRPLDEPPYQGST